MHLGGDAWAVRTAVFLAALVALLVLLNRAHRPTTEPADTDHPQPPPEVNQDLATQYALAYSEAQRALESQQRVLESFRSRAATIIAAATIATSFLGSRAFSNGRPQSDWTWAAIACFAGVIVADAIVLWPRIGWEFEVRAEDLIDQSIEGLDRPQTIVELHRDLAIHMSRAHDTNRTRMRLFVWAIQAAVILLGAEICGWVFTLR